MESMSMLLIILAAFLACVSKVHSLSSSRDRSDNHYFSRREYIQIEFMRTAATASATLLTPEISNAVTYEDNADQQGISAITNSQLGRSFRKSVVRGAQLADKLDEQWERFSDSLRDKSRCDPNTGRRLYDNGKRKDGTPIGNPGLGELCSPEPLFSLNVSLAESILDAAVNSALIVSTEDEKSKRDILENLIQDTKQLVRPSFDRSMQTFTTDDERNRGMFNCNFYSTLRAIATFLHEDKSSMRAFQIAWGDNLLSRYASSSNRKDFQSPFPGREDEFQDFDYDKDILLDSLGQLTATLNELKYGGLLSYYEISIPYDDYGSVVTVALDNYALIGAEILLSEQNIIAEGPIHALVRALFDRAKISLALNTFYIDPSTTRQDNYNPTQLLLSLNDLRKIN